jgi:GGDEF domain-containing protein
MAVAPHTDAAGAQVLATRLVEGVRGLRFESAGKQIPIRVTIGAATMADENTLYFDQLVGAAETALEDGASAGGDRVVARDPRGGGG